jgi:hypothetical protein
MARSALASANHDELRAGALTCSRRTRRARRGWHCAPTSGSRERSARPSALPASRTGPRLPGLASFGMEGELRCARPAVPPRLFRLRVRLRVLSAPARCRPTSSCHPTPRFAPVTSSRPPKSSLAPRAAATTLLSDDCAPELVGQRRMQQLRRPLESRRRAALAARSVATRCAKPWTTSRMLDNTVL